MSDAEPEAAPADVPRGVGEIEAGWLAYAALRDEVQRFAQHHSPLPVSVRSVDVGPGWAHVEVMFTLTSEQFPAMEHEQGWWNWQAEGETWTKAIDRLLADLGPYLSGETPLPPTVRLSPVRQVVRPTRPPRGYTATLVLGKALRALGPDSPIFRELDAKHPEVVRDALRLVPVTEGE